MASSPARARAVSGSSTTAAHSSARLEIGRVSKQQAFRARTPSKDLVGYAWMLEAACDRLWAWHVLVRTGGEYDCLAVAADTDR